MVAGESGCRPDKRKSRDAACQLAWVVTVTADQVVGGTCFYQAGLQVLRRAPLNFKLK